MLIPHTTDCEDALRLSHFTIEHVPDAVLWVNSKAVICHVNQVACRLLGYTFDELIGQPVYLFHLDETEQKWRQRWRKIKTKRHLVFERMQPTQDGQLIPVEVRANFIEFEGEEYLCSFLRDISDRKQAEEDLEESQRQLTTLLHNLPGAVYRSKPDDRLTIEFITDWCQRITGYSADALIHNHTIAAIDLIAPDDREKVLAHRRACLQEHKPGRIMYRITSASGDEKWVSDRFQGVYADNGEVIAVEGFFNDISQQIRAEKDLTQALLEVEHLKNRLQEENIYLRQEIQLTYNFQHIISANTGLKSVLAQVEQVAATDATVLILGETGTGKELIARSVHSLSPRKERSLVKVNCAALPANLIESDSLGMKKAHLPEP
jgi:PAS domain S-box-containing protein